MRIRQAIFNGYECAEPPQGLGFTVPSSMLVPMARPQPFGGFGDAQDDWCDQNYWTPVNNAKCRTHTPIVNVSPKTIVGRLARGLPQQTDLETMGPPPTVPEVPSIPEAGDSWFDQNKVLVVGGGLGLAALLLATRGRRGKGFFGLGGKKRKARR